MKNASLLSLLALAIAFAAGLSAQDHRQALGAHPAAGQKPELSKTRDIERATARDDFHTRIAALKFQTGSVDVAAEA